MQSLPHRTRLLIVLTFILVIGFFTSTFGNFLVSRATIRENLLAQELPLTGDNIYSELQKDLLRPVFISSLMARDTFLRDWVLEGEHNDVALFRYLAEIQKQYGTVTTFFVSDITRRYYRPNLGVGEVRESTDPWFFRVRNMSHPYEINVDLDKRNMNTLMVFINYRVIDYKGNFIGVTGVGMAFDKITHLFESYQRRFNRHIFFVSPQGEVMLRAANDAMTDNIFSMPGIKTVAKKIVGAGKAPVTLQYTLNGSNTHVNARYIAELGWYLVVEQDETASLGALHQMAYFNLAISCVVTILVLVVTWYSVRYYQRRLEQMAVTDELTGLLNRQALETVFGQIEKDIKRKPFSLSVMIIDIDHFKHVNDTYGHLVGDKVLVATAGVIRASLRQSDVTARWGGGEFIVVLQDCAIAEAGNIAEQIRKAIEASQIEWKGQVIKVTASIGLSQLDPEESLQDLFIRTDDALYRAKSAGRNCVQVSPGN